MMSLSDTIAEIEESRGWIFGSPAMRNNKRERRLEPGLGSIGELARSRPNRRWPQAV